MWDYLAWSGVNGMGWSVWHGEEYLVWGWSIWHGVECLAWGVEYLVCGVEYLTWGVEYLMWGVEYLAWGGVSGVGEDLHLFPDNYSHSTGWPDFLY